MRRIWPSFKVFVLNRLKLGNLFVSVVVSLAVLLLAPDSTFESMNVSSLMGLVILFPATFIAGILSYWIYYSKHDLMLINPFYIRAWLALIAGLVALPVCLLLRPSVAHIAFILAIFGFGPVSAFHVYHRTTRREQVSQK